MNAPIKLSLAIALALGGANAWALGLGAIQVKSALNQPLVAEIPVIVSSPGEAAELQAIMARDEDFQRVGLSRSHVGATLEFAVVTNPHGDTVIRVTSVESVREPYLDFLIQANWAKGKLLREYTVLLDPPVTAPVSASAPNTALASEPKSRPPAPVVAKAPPPPRETPVPAASAPTPARAVTSKPSAPAAPAPVTERPPAYVADGKPYGPVAAGSALSQIARTVRTDKSTDLNQLMLAMLKANPEAFYRPNVNALKSGAVLRIPSADEVQAVGSVREAAAQVSSQTRDWTSGNGPTMIASNQTDGGKKPDKTAGADFIAKDASKSERLALVPPRAGKDEQGKSDQPGAASHSKTVASNASAAELARTQEALVAREHETTELKSRLKDLEDIKSKNDRLINLKDSEIAELQRKLKDTQDTAAKAAAKLAATPPPVAPVVTPAATPPVPVNAMASKPGSDSKPAPDAIKPAADVKPPVEVKSTPDNKASTDVKAVVPAAVASSTSAPSSEAEKVKALATPAPTTAPDTAKPETAPATPAAVTTSPATVTALPSSTPPPAATPSAPATPPAASTPPITNTTVPASSETPHVTPPPATSVTPPVTPPSVTPATSKPVAPTVAKAAEPSNAAPWYTDTRILISGAVALLILGVLALLRSRKPAAPIRPVRENVVAQNNDPAHDADHDEEHAMLEALARHPDDIEHHLELLSLYYARRDVPKFEAAAEAMHAQITDPTQIEWQQVKAMGAELAPTHPLFSEDDHFGHYDTANIDTELHQNLAGHAQWTNDEHPGASTSMHTTELDALALPPLHELDHVVHEEHEPVNTHHDVESVDHVDAAPFAAESISFDDTIVTKLDLARAYLDMGDHEGARGMAEEVLAEGSEAQQGEARKLLEEIR